MIAYGMYQLIRVSSFRMLVSYCCSMGDLYVPKYTQSSILRYPQRCRRPGIKPERFCQHIKSMKIVGADSSEISWIDEVLIVATRYQSKLTSKKRCCMHYALFCTHFGLKWELELLRTRIASVLPSVPVWWLSGGGRGDGCFDRLLKEGLWLLSALPPPWCWPRTGC